MLKLNAQVISIVGAILSASFLIVAALLLSAPAPIQDDTAPFSEEFSAPDMQNLPNELWISQANPRNTILLQSDSVFREYTDTTQTGYGKWEAKFFFDEPEYGIGELVFTYAPEGIYEKKFTIMDATAQTLILLNTETKEEDVYTLAQKGTN